MRITRSDSRNNSFADASHDRVFRRAADKLSQIGSHGNSGTRFQLNSILGHSVERRATERFGVRAVDDFGIDARLHCFQDISASEVNRRRRVPVEFNSRPVGNDQRANNRLDITAGEIMSLQPISRDIAQPRLNRHNLCIDDRCRIHFSQ